MQDEAADSTLSFASNTTVHTQLLARMAACICCSATALLVPAHLEQSNFPGYIYHQMLLRVSLSPLCLLRMNVFLHSDVVWTSELEVHVEGQIAC